MGEVSGDDMDIRGGARNGLTVTPTCGGGISSTDMVIVIVIL
jgi:hypothetical protein